MHVGNEMEPIPSRCLALCLFLHVSLSLQQHSVVGQSGNTNLTFMLIISYGEFGFNSSGGLPAAEMALEDINSDPGMLPGYNLVYDRIRNSQCHRGVSLDTFFNGVLSDPVKLAVAGCGCSVATEPVAEISYQWNISQISFSSGSPALSDRSRFRKYFRNSPNSEIVAPTLRSTTNHFGWTRVAIITQDEALFRIAEARFREEFASVNITAESRMFSTEDDPIETTDLFAESEDYRVFILNAYSGPALRIICEAFKRNYTYPRYAWITYNWYPRQWWTQNVTKVEVDCTEDELEGFLERVITLQRYQTLDDENATTDFGIILADFEEEYSIRAMEGNFDTVDVRFRIYDALWALAMALNGTMTMVNNSDIDKTGCQVMNGSMVPLEDFTYDNALMGCLIQWNLQKTDFFGVSGDVKFDENGTRIQNRTTLFQYRFRGGDLVRERIAYLERDQNYKLSLEPGETITTVYPDGIPPDGAPLQVINTFQIALVVIFYFLATIGIIFAVGCFLFNFIFRKRKLIKLSSPKLNYFITVGAALMYTAIYFYFLPVIDKNAVKARCIIEHWLFTIGYSLAFGTVLVKMWRVYQIFNNPKLNKKVLKDWHLLVCILVITGVAVLLLLVETVVPQLHGSVTQERDQEQPSGKTALNVSIEFYVLVCYEGFSPSFLWQIFIFVYLAVLQIVGILLAFQTRKVKFQGLRDSKFIAAIIYISSIVLVALALVTFSLRTYINIGTGIFAGGIFILTSIFLSLIFLPKMIMLYRDPKGETVGNFAPSVEITGPNQFGTNQSGTNEEEKVTLLKTLKEKEDKINELTMEIQTLKDEAHQWKEQNGHENLTNGINETKVSDHTTVTVL